MWARACIWALHVYTHRHIWAWAHVHIYGHCAHNRHTHALQYTHNILEVRGRVGGVSSPSTPQPAARGAPWQQSHDRRGLPHSSGPWRMHFPCPHSKGTPPQPGAGLEGREAMAPSKVCSPLLLSQCCCFQPEHTVIPIRFGPPGVKVGRWEESQRW